jgi:tetratricopeptide (TPR) repeat protein
VNRRFGKLAGARLLLALFLFLLPGLLFARAAQDPASAAMERQFQQAMEAENRGDMARAESLLSGLHASHPGIFAVDESLGLLFAWRGDLARALPLLEDAVREQPSSDAAHANLGAALYGLHRNRPALEEFERAVRINPRIFSAQQSLGRLWMDSHDPSQAANAFLAALRLKPGDADLAMDCATALLAANRTREAAQILSRLAGAEQSARAQSLLGQMEEKDGQFKSAAQHFARAAQLDPSEENAWMMGLELLRHWNFKAAEIEFAAASAKFPGSRRLRLGLGAADFGGANYTAAIDVFAGLLEADPQNAAYAQLLGISCSVMIQAGNTRRCAVLLRYAQSHPADSAAATYAASWLLDHHRDPQTLETARKLLTPAIAANPNLPEAQLQMGTVLQEQMNWKGSIPYLERAVKLQPDLTVAHYRLARAYWRTGRRREGDAQMALQRKYVHQNQIDLDQRLRQVTSLAVSIQQ